MTKIAKLLSVVVALSGLLLLAGCDGENNNNEPDPFKLAETDHDPQMGGAGQVGNDGKVTYKDRITVRDAQGSAAQFDVDAEFDYDESDWQAKITAAAEWKLNDLWYLNVGGTFNTAGPDSGWFSFTRRW